MSSPSRASGDVVEQRPFCNVFKSFAVDQGGSECERRGSVESVLDPILNKRVTVLVSFIYCCFGGVDRQGKDVMKYKCAQN